MRRTRNTLMSSRYVSQLPRDIFGRYRSFGSMLSVRSAPSRDELISEHESRTSMKADLESFLGTESMTRVERCASYGRWIVDARRLEACTMLMID